MEGPRPPGTPTTRRRRLPLPLPTRLRLQLLPPSGGELMPIRPENRARYPADWPQISHRIRHDRAAGQCECHGECRRGTHHGRCPNHNGQPAYGTGSTVVLTVAHLNHVPEDCRDENLRAMCQGCHLHYDRDHHAQTRAATTATRHRIRTIDELRARYPNRMAQLDILDLKDET